MNIFFSRTSTILFLFFFCGLAILHAQPGSFEKRYGTAQREYAVQMISCDNGDFFALAWRGRETLVLRMDIAGNEIWSRVLSDSSTIGLNPRRCIQTHDHGFCILAGPAYSFMHPNVLGCTGLIKLDSQGQLLWIAQLTDSFQTRFYGTDIAETPDGSLYIQGSLIPFCSSSCPFHPYLMKFHPNGQLAWSRSSPSSFYGYRDDRLHASSDTTLTCVINEYPDFRKVAIDSSGNVTHSELWFDPSGAELNLNDWDWDSTGHLEAMLLSNGNSEAVSICRFDAQQNFSTLRLSKSGYNLDGIQLEKADTGYVVMMKSSGSSNIMMTDLSDGSIKPNCIRVGTDSAFYPFSFVRRSDGSLFVYGSLYSPTYAYPDPHLVKTDIATNGILPLTGCSVDTTLLALSPYTISDSANNFSFQPYAVYPTVSYLVDSDILLGQFTDCTVTGVPENNRAVNELLVYPNPSNGNFELSGNFETTMRLYIYNLQGEEATKSIPLPEGNHSVSIASGLAPGVYVYRIESGKGTQREGKLVILR